MNKNSKQTKNHGHNGDQGLHRGEGGGAVKEARGQVYAEGRFDFGWWAHNATYRCRLRTVRLKPV